MNLLKQFCLCYYFLSPIFTSAFPYYEAKRFQRAQLPTTPSVISQIPRQSYYNHYYKQQPGPNYYDQQENPNTKAYIASSGFYHYPSHNTKYYGMPTYQGEYMPQPYYYAKSPKYSYYEDREEPTSNPLDDLQEEIRYEEQKDLEEWYEHKQREAQTNNFLRNLIAYNREMDEEQRIQQENENSQHIPNEYDDYMGMDYDYESSSRQEQPQNLEYYDLPQNFKSSKQEQQFLNKHYPERISLKESYNNGDDEVKQLNSLIKSKEYNRIDDQVDFSDQRKYASFENNADYDVGDDWISWERKRSLPNKEKVITAFTNRKISTTPNPTVFTTTTTTPTPEIKSPTLTKYGQKEKVLFRPANSRHNGKQSMIESNNVLDNSNKNSNGNIYDTIKHLIALDKALDNESGHHIKQKRFALVDDLLVNELDNLKENH